MPVTVHPAPANGTYAPRVDEILLDPGDLIAMTGGPNTSSLMGVPSWALDADAAAEFVGRTLRLPSHWETMNVFISWGSSTATTGDAVFRCDWAEVTDPPRSTPTFTAGGNVISTVPGTTQDAKEITLLSGVAVDPTLRFVFRLGRLGSNASDDLVGDAHLTEVRLVNAAA